MPKKVVRKIGEVHEVRTVKTIWDKIKAFLEGLAGVAVVLVIAMAILG